MIDESRINLNDYNLADPRIWEGPALIDIDRTVSYEQNVSTGGLKTANLVAGFTVAPKNLLLIKSIQLLNMQMFIDGTAPTTNNLMLLLYHEGRELKRFVGSTVFQMLDVFWYIDPGLVQFYIWHSMGKNCCLAVHVNAWEKVRRPE